MPAVGAIRRAGKAVKLWPPDFQAVDLLLYPPLAGLVAYHVLREAAKGCTGDYYAVGVYVCGVIRF